MFTASNDAVYSFDEEGFLLFEADESSVIGEITSKIWLRDAGTEKNEPPFTGENQPKNPLVINEGEATVEGVRLLIDDRYPPRNQVIKVLVTSKEI